MSAAVLVDELISESEGIIQYLSSVKRDQISVAETEWKNEILKTKNDIGELKRRILCRRGENSK